MSTVCGRNGRSIAALAALLFALAAPAAAQEPVPSGRAPVLLFISGSSAAELPGPVAEVRAAATAGLEAALADAGFAVVGTDALMPRLMSHRVRSAYALAPAFLQDLGAGTGASHLLVAVLLVESQRLQLLVRLVELETACAVWARTDEEAVPRPDLLREDFDPVAWYAALGRLCRDGAPDSPRTAPAAGRPLVLLPVRPLACSQELGLAATHSLLAPVAGNPGWRVLDPGVAAAVLRDAGVPWDRLDADGRGALAATLGGSLLAAPEIMVYGPVARGGQAAQRADSGVPESAAEEYEISLRFVDAGSGTVSANFARQRHHGISVGWFGLRDERSLLAGLAAAAQSLWHEVDSNLEDR